MFARNSVYIGSQIFPELLFLPTHCSLKMTHCFLLFSGEAGFSLIPESLFIRIWVKSIWISWSCFSVTDLKAIWLLTAYVSPKVLNVNFFLEVGNSGKIVLKYSIKSRGKLPLHLNLSVSAISFISKFILSWRSYFSMPMIVFWIIYHLTYLHWSGHQGHSSIALSLCGEWKGTRKARLSQASHMHLYYSGWEITLTLLEIQTLKPFTKEVMETKIMVTHTSFRRCCLLCSTQISCPESLWTSGVHFLPSVYVAYVLSTPWGQRLFILRTPAPPESSSNLCCAFCSIYRQLFQCALTILTPPTLQCPNLLRRTEPCVLVVLFSH